MTLEEENETLREELAELEDQVIQLKSKMKQMEVRFEKDLKTARGKGTPFKLVSEIPLLRPWEP